MSDAAIVVPVWRRTPPTAAQVRSCRWWWRRWPARQAAEVDLYVLAVRPGTEEVLVDCGDSRYPLCPESPEDERSEWAPCTPPGDVVSTAAPCCDLLSQGDEVRLGATQREQDSAADLDDPDNDRYDSTNTTDDLELPPPLTDPQRARLRDAISKLRTQRAERRTWREVWAGELAARPRGGGRR